MSSYGFHGGGKRREIFEARRKACLEDVAAVPVANQGFRLHELYLAAKKAKNWKLAAELLEQSAKEASGALTNERNLRIDDNRPIRARDMTPEERRLAITDLFRQALERREELLAIAGNAA